MDINIRGMTEADIKAIVEIEEEVFTTPWSEGAFLTEIRENKLAQYFVVEINKKVVGYGGIWLIINEGHITNIAIKEEYRGRGFGSKILEALIYICQLKNISSMTLEVRRSNKIAQELYKKYGFVDCGIRPKYYADNKEDAIIMWRKN